MLGKRWRTTEPEIRDLLRIGAYQLRELTRVPPYAAVQSTVEAAKALGRKPATFVNAVLRRVALLGQGESNGSRRASVARCSSASASNRNRSYQGARSRDPARPIAGTRAAPSALAEQYSHPEWLVRRWIERYGRVATEALLAHHNTRPPLVIQPARWPCEHLQRALTVAGIEWHEAPGGFGLIVRHARPRELPGFAEGGFMVQGPGHARLLAHAAVPGGLTVWDCCAAPGGKAVALAARGPVLASDRGRTRLRLLVETAGRLDRWTGGRSDRATEPAVEPSSRPAVQLFAADALRPPLRAGAVDVVWLDAPCTATATMARHPDARWRVSPRRLEVACRRQARLLNAAAGVVRTGGWLVYSTCSLEPEENELQVDAFLRREPGFVRERKDLTAWPPDTGSDGGFVAVLRKR